MKAIGIIRKVDGANRVVIPDEVCQMMKIEKHTPLEVFVDIDNETIIFKKYNPGCFLCRSRDGLEYYKGKFICQECRNNMPK